MITNTEDSNIIIEKGQDLLTINVSRRVTKESITELLWVPVDKELVQEGLARIDFVKETNAREVLEESLAHYHELSLNAVKILSEKDINKETKLQNGNKFFTL